MKKRFYVDIIEDVYNTVVRRTELLSRGNPDLPVNTIITDRDKDTLQVYFSDFIMEFKNETAGFGMVKDYDGLLSYQMTEDEQKRGVEELKPLLVQIAVEYLLKSWYAGLGIMQMSAMLEGLYQKKIREWKTNTTKKAFVEPKYHPYF